LTATPEVRRAIVARADAKGEDLGLDDPEDAEDSAVPDSGRFFVCMLTRNP
jgi:hypothetical protein